MKGTFTAVIHCEWAMGRRRPVSAVIALVLLVLLACRGSVARFGLLLWVLAVAVIFALAAAVIGLLALRRWNRQQAGQFVTMLAALPAERHAAPPPLTVIQHFHAGTHLHLSTEADLAAFTRLVPDAISERGELT